MFRVLEEEPQQQAMSLVNDVSRLQQKAPHLHPVFVLGKHHKLLFLDHLLIQYVKAS